MKETVSITESHHGNHRGRIQPNPVRYPTASSPQARAAGAPLLGLRVLLGLDVNQEQLESRPSLPEWVGTLTLENIPGRWGRNRASAERKNSPLLSGAV